MQYIVGSFGLHDVALLVARTTLGVFFVLARFRWVYDPSRPAAPWFNPGRRESLAAKLCHCGWPKSYVLAAAVAVVEIAAGLALIVGLMSTWAAFGMLVILVAATHCTAKEKTMRQNPVDGIDVVSCYLWVPEPVYIALALIVLVAGPGAFSIDALVLGWFR